MTDEYLTHDDIVAMLKAEQGTTSTSAFAGTLQVSRQYLYDVYNHAREPGPTILNYLGITKTVEKKTIYKRWR